MTLEEKLVLATHNRGKLSEIQALLQDFGVDVVSSADLALPEPDETGRTFRENAAVKAVAAARAAGLPALADDSGLCVQALGGQPGIHSARWAGPHKDFARAMKRVWDALTVQQGGQQGADHRAAFVCCLCLAQPDGTTAFFEGSVHGQIVWPPRGAGGFGYDGFFQPEGSSRTFGEMPAEDKQALSHRTRAFDLLVQNCFGPQTAPHNTA